MKIKTPSTPAAAANRMTPKLSAVAERRIAAAPTKYRKLALRVMQAQATPRQAIRIMCLSCTGYERKEVEACTAVECPLWNFRPFKMPTAKIAEHHQKVNRIELPGHWSAENN